jgi:hypothetical protein
MKPSGPGAPPPAAELFAIAALAIACRGRAEATDRSASASESTTEPSSIVQSATAAAAASAEASAPPVAPASASAPAPPVPFSKQPITRDYASGPFYFTPAYDGSLRFSLWTGTLAFARRMERLHGQRPHFTFFVNAAFYTTERGKSDVGHATTRDEVLVRRALTQLAINDGHEIGDHGMGHLDGRGFDEAAWTEELDRFHAVMDHTLFEPLLDASGEPAFPKFVPLPAAEAGKTGAACEKDDDCTSGPCVDLGSAKLCSQACNLSQRCPKGTACGAPMFRDDTDLCLPPPAFPVKLDGETLFDAKGNANPKSKRLVPYRIFGFRAPYLGVNDALYQALIRRGYVYDTSQAQSPPEPPYFLASGDRKILQLALMPHPGALAIPMDYNYRLEKGSPERMRDDYRAALEASYKAGRRPWNIGHHFASWGDGTYLPVLEETIEHALSGCPVGGEKRCPETRVVSFRELATVVKGGTVKATAK